MNLSPNHYCYCGSNKKYKNCCFRTAQLLNTQTQISGITLFRPSFSAERKVSYEAAKFLGQNFKDGRYEDFQDVDKIFKKLVEFYRNKLNELEPLLASREVFDFLMIQYDRGAVLDEIEKNGFAEFKDKEQWHIIGPTYRRAIKFLAEKMLLSADTKGPKIPQNNLIPSIENAIIFAEQLINYCILSDQTRLFPKDTVVDINCSDIQNYLNHSVGDTRILEYWERVSFHRDQLNDVYGDVLLHFDVPKVASYLDETLGNSFGFTFTEAIGLLNWLNDHAKPDSETTPICFVLKEKVVASMAEVFGKSPDVIEKILSGFSVRKLEVEKEKRNYWNPQCHSRAYRRGIFEMPHVSGMHLAWSKSLFAESIILFLADLQFGQFPNEWRTESVEKSIASIVSDRGKWFENKVAEKLSELGFLGVKSRNYIGNGESSISFPVGEIDYLGVNPIDNTVLFLECKMLQDGTEPKMWKNQIESFISSSSNKSFEKKFEKKIDWLLENRGYIFKALRSEKLLSKSDPKYFHTSFVTFSPSPATYFLSKHNCVSLPELLRDLHNYEKWPYQLGTFSL